MTFLLALVAAFSFFSSASWAQRRFSDDMARGISKYWLAPSAQRLAELPDVNFTESGLSASERAACQRTYQRVLQKGRMEVRMAFGYLDVSEGKDYTYNGESWGNAASIDLFSRMAMISVLTSDCRGRLQACGFRVENGDMDTLTKTIRGPNGASVQVTLHLKNGSVGPFFEDNTGVLAPQQQAFTAAADQNFFGSVGTADALIYMGHSRNGGGPDFNPPRLRSNGHPDYKGYYQAKRPGLKRLVRELKTAPQVPTVLAVLSCLSEHHFGRALREAAPEAGFLYTDSDALTDIDDILRGGFAAVDSFMRMQCRSGFQKELDVSAADKPRILMRSLLGAPSSGGRRRPPPNSGDLND